MKKFLLIAVAVFSLLVASNSYACVGDKCNFDNEVKSVGEGNKGNIFVYDCTKNGNIDVGTWVDPKDVPELRGEKGDTGERGSDGLNGLNGQNGQDGHTPIKGVDYVDGQDGATGQDGKTPIKGVDYNDGKDGLNGIDGKTPIKNIDYFDGINGLNGTNGKDVDPKTVNELNNKIGANSNRIDKLEESQYIVGGVLRIKSTKKWDVDLFADYSTNRQMIDRSGIRFTYKVGESYTDKKINELERRIKNIEDK